MQLLAQPRRKAVDAPYFNQVKGAIASQLQHVCARPAAVLQARGDIPPLPPLSFLHLTVILAITLIFSPSRLYGPLSRHPASPTLPPKVFPPLPFRFVILAPAFHRFNTVNPWIVHLRGMPSTTPYYA
jgi:hypothetical protein